MTIFNWFALFGIPSLIGGFWLNILKSIKNSDKQTKALQLGVQALLRERLLYLYREFFKQGYVNYSDRQTVENMYKQYHVLGENGVMDDMHRRFMNLPIEVEENCKLN